MSAPLVGVSCYVEAASWGVWRGVPTALLPHAYVAQLQRAGFAVVLVPPDARAVETVPRLDALVLSGGADLDPARYGQEPHPAAQPPRPHRDAGELALLRAAVDRDLPVLGVCRGMQLMAVLAGGALDQHLPETVGHDGHAPARGRYGTHRVTTAPGTRLAAIIGADVEVPTYHHQGVRSHPGYTASATADDGTVEAMEHPDARFRIGVQWHPEVGDDPRLFDALRAAAER